MSQTAITSAFEQWKARQSLNNEVIELDEFVFALVPGLDVSAPVDRAENLPPAAQIVHRQAVSRTGMVNENAVVFSVVLGADVGDFSFNWIGLANKSSNTLAMVVHAPEQQKLKTEAGQQGNVLTRSFLLEFNGAQKETAINTPADTWQIDFTARMAGMDEARRLAALDIYGRGAFQGDGFLVTRSGATYFVTQGVGYIGGLRAELATSEILPVATLPVKVWADVSYQGGLTSAYDTRIKFTLETDQADYHMNGVAHYVFAVASIDATGVITDLRPKGSLDGQLGNSTFMRKDNSLSDVASVEAARRNLGLKVLSELAGDANKLPYFTGGNTAALTTLTKLAREIIEKETAPQVLNHLGAAALNSPALVGTPTAPTPVTGNVSSQIATTEFTINEIINAITSLGLGGAASRNVGNEANQIPDMSFFSIVTGEAGWAKFPNGIILQWCQVAPFGGGLVDVYYPISFPTKVLFTGKYTYSGLTSPTSSSLLEIINPKLTGFTVANIGAIVAGYNYVAPAIVTGAIFFSVGY